MGGMSQPAYLVGAKVSPNQLIWSLEHIRCPKFGRGAGGQQRLGQCPNFQTFCFLMASLSYSIGYALVYSNLKNISKDYQLDYTVTKAKG